MEFRIRSPEKSRLLRVHMGRAGLKVGGLGLNFDRSIGLLRTKLGCRAQGIELRVENRSQV